MTNHRNTSTPLHIAAWICQILLALTLLWASGMKLFKPASQLAQMWPWTAPNPLLTKLTGVLDFLGALGLILPQMLRIRPILTAYTAYAIIALMVAASVFHITRGEASQIGINVVFALMAAFIAWVRSKKTPA